MLSTPQRGLMVTGVTQPSPNSAMNRVESEAKLIESVRIMNCMRSDAATRKEMIAQSVALRKSQEVPPPWVDLALAQAAIDTGDLDGARTAMTRFNARWNGHPASLMDYALELDRWLASHAAP